MLRDLIRHVATETGLTQAKTREALGVIFNAAERQGSPFAEALFRRLPGARTLSARTGSQIDAPNGVIARLIEQTPGGRRSVAAAMIRELQALDLGHKQIGAILPALAAFAEEHYDITGFGHLGDLIGSDLDTDAGETGKVSKVA
ncbi:MAG: hypothetical protein GVY06_06000 [Alphaproteobacteria bacterium]|jgi:hypothetical protein|nr:hypothetical protein [Alphaproteobacteria bacterium]